ncbi:hypothetical protein, partial [Klebsiella oxytoca]|uniref:hypothetical protein n=1 Tax=Klebsiella oxytoca TaxID=571 RepID=UPI00254F6C2A
TTSRRFSKGYFGFDISGAIPFHRPTKWVQYMGDYITFGAFFFLPQHNGKTQSCPEAKASSAAKNHTPDDGKYTISLYLLVFMTIGC